MPSMRPMSARYCAPLNSAVSPSSNASRTLCRRSLSGSSSPSCALSAARSASTSARSVSRLAAPCCARSRARSSAWTSCATCSRSMRSGQGACVGSEPFMCFASRTESGFTLACPRRAGEQSGLILAARSAFPPLRVAPPSPMPASTPHAASPAASPLPRQRLQRAMWPLLVIVPVTLALVWASMEVLAASRAYLASLGYWSRAQKDAVVYLLRYAETRNAADYEAHRPALRVPMGDRMAREALRREPTDRARAREGFIAGGNAPEDADKLIGLFVNYGDSAFLRDAVRAWDATDAGLDRLAAAGERLDALLRTDDATPAAIGAITAEVEAVNASLDPLQHAFATALGEGFKRVRLLLYGALSLTALALLALAWLSSRRMIARVLHAEEELAIAERAVSAERDRALVTLQSIGDAVITAGADGRIDYLNPVAEKVTGWSNAEAVGQIGR